MNNVIAKDGTNLFCREWGSGPPVVLVHGWTMGAAMWEYQISFLAHHGFRAIAYDQRGCGRSGWPASGYDFDTLADDLELVLNRYDLDRASIVTFSMGAGVLARYLARHGAARVDRAVLVAPITPYLLRTPDNPEGMDRALIYDPFSAGLAVDRPQTLNAATAAWFGATGVSSEMTRWALSLCDQSDPAAMLELYRQINETDFRPDLPAFQGVPTLVAHGAADPFALPAATAHRTAAAIPNSRLALYDGASHGLFLTHREQFHADLLAFLRHNI